MLMVQLQAACLLVRDRQSLINSPKVEGHSVLLGQIQAGGVGLNIQAANVVIICEPQVKPTLEEQAIARLYRMGQVRSVQAHRLLVTNSVDQRMIELLAAKSRLFDDYARRSEVAENSSDAGISPRSNSRVALSPPSRSVWHEKRCRRMLMISYKRPIRRGRA
ncbi:MAG: helicase-related protein [Pseudonocardiaceae bacterium]